MKESIWMELLLVIITICGATAVHTVDTVPALIVDEPPQEVPFRESETVLLACNASGSPSPTYQWYMDGYLFDPSGQDGRVIMLPETGSLLFAPTIARDEGFYQCFAQNPYGTSLTVKALMKVGYLDNFEPSSTNIYRPSLGTTLTLPCKPPRSYPKANVFWAIVLEDGRIEPLELTQRVSMDHEGNLHFVNIIAEDEKQGRRYSCLVQNVLLRSVTMGEYAIILPQGASPIESPPTILWHSPTHQLALRGDIWKAKCIYAGNPTPLVEWTRLDYVISNSDNSTGQEIIVENIQLADQGRYECKGTNNQSLVPVRRLINLVVESKPSWIRKPESVDAAVNSDAEFYCKADAIPEATFYWLLNGVPIKDTPPNPRLIVEKNKLTFIFLRKEDTQVIQCNATNKHGYIFANAYLDVVGKGSDIQQGNSYNTHLEPPYPGPFNSASRLLLNNVLLWTAVIVILKCVM